MLLTEDECAALLEACDELFLSSTSSARLLCLPGRHQPARGDAARTVSRLGLLGVLAVLVVACRRSAPANRGQRTVSGLGVLRVGLVLLRVVLLGVMRDARGLGVDVDGRGSDGSSREGSEDESELQRISRARAASDARAC